MPDGQTESNGKRLKEKPQIEPPLMPHLLAWFFEIGPVVNYGMGGTPITWKEIESWQNVTGVKLSPTEANIMRELSVEYINHHRICVKDGGISPLMPLPEKDRVVDLINKAFA